MNPSVTPANIFVDLDDDEAYAATPYDEWHLLVRQTENFKLLKIEGIEPENRECEICLEQYGSSDNNQPPEEPIQLLSCGHVFGHKCLSSWLARFMPYGKWWNWFVADVYLRTFPAHDEAEFREAILYTSAEDVSVAFQADGQRKPDWRDHLNWHFEDRDLFPRAAPTPSEHDVFCPKCRGEFSLVRSGVIGEKIKARLQFWDLLYQKLGITRSAKEEQSRSDLLRYLQMVEVPKIEVQPEHRRPFTLQAQVSAMRFALRRGNRTLHPLQTYLRDAIFNLGCYGLHEGEYNPNSYENRKVPIWCYQVDRIERRLSPFIVDWIYQFGGTQQQQHQQPSTLTAADESDRIENIKRIFRQMNITSGPWRRALFSEAGGKFRNCDQLLCPFFSGLEGYYMHNFERSSSS